VWGLYKYRVFESCVLNQKYEVEGVVEWLVTRMYGDAEEAIFVAFPCVGVYYL
jgi:hypothetical protein